MVSCGKREITKSLKGSNLEQLNLAIGRPVQISKISQSRNWCLKIYIEQQCLRPNLATCGEKKAVKAAP